MIPHCRPEQAASLLIDCQVSTLQLARTNGRHRAAEVGNWSTKPGQQLVPLLLAAAPMQKVD